MNKGPNPKRMRGRGNGRGGGRKHNNQRSNVFDSNGPEVRIRGTAQQVLEKYLSLAREASANGDHVSAEGFYQYAEHYYRVHQAMQENAEVNRPKPRSRPDEQGEAGQNEAAGSDSDQDGNAGGRQRRGNGGGRNQPRSGERESASDSENAGDVTPDGREALRPNGQHAVTEAQAVEPEPQASEAVSAEDKPAVS